MVPKIAMRRLGVCLNPWIQRRLEMATNTLRLSPISLYLHIRPGFVCDFHDKFTAFSIGWVHEVVKNVKVHSGTQIIYIGHKNIFLPLCNEVVQQPRVVEAGIDVSMAWRVPALRVLSWVRDILGYWQQSFLVNSGVPVRTMGLVTSSPVSE